MPQLDFLTWNSQCFWLILFFLTLYFRVTLFYLPKIAEGLKIRLKARKRDDLELIVLKEESQKICLGFEKILKESVQITKWCLFNTLQGFEISINQNFQKINFESLNVANQFYIDVLIQWELGNFLFAKKIRKICEIKKMK